MDCRIKKHLIALVFSVVLPQSLVAQPLWSDVSVANKNAAATPDSSLQAKPLGLNPHISSRRVSVDYNQLKSTLATSQIDLPMPYGGLQTFNVAEISVMAPELAAKYPQIKTYKVVSANDASITGVVDTGAKGFHAYLHTADGEVFIDPLSSTQQEYYSYYKRDYANITPRQFSCGVMPQTVTESPVADLKTKTVTTLARTSDNLITYRTAIAATGEYSQAVKNAGSTTAAQITVDTLSEITTAIARINLVYERDLAVRLVLIANNDQIIYTDAANDPYTSPANPSLLLDHNQANLDSMIGEANYDLGHVFGTDGGGLAILGAACVGGYKAQGESGHPNPVGDPFHIDIVAHELGHQLGANHSFNGTTDSCADNRNAATAFEPGSGSTIMSYGGICGSENTTVYSDDMFHAGSIAEIVAYTRLGDGNTCSGSVATQLAPGNVNAGLDYTIPGGTAFTLAGSAIDPESDIMKYQWDQMDAGIATTASSYGNDNGSNALFRSYLATTSTTRTFPALATLLGTNVDPLAAKAETLPTENRTLNFRFTARDGNGGVGEDDMQIIVDGNAGPFEIIQPNSNVVLNPNLSQLVEWNTACTNTAPINCANVDIQLSTDGGQTFASVVGGTTLNDGSEPVTFPAGDSATARIKIACTDNIFFDISDVDFEINSASGGSLTPSGIAPSCGTASGVVITTQDVEPNNYVAQAQTITSPLIINGTVNNIVDVDDFFVFVANNSAYTITLNNYGNNDLDLYLLDSTGLYIIVSSTSGSSTTESIRRNLVEGETYYVVVNGWDTAAQDSSYQLEIAESAISSDGGGVLNYYWLLMLLITPMLRFNRKNQ